MRQPPSGGCVLKRVLENNTAQRDAQPPSGGCVLKRPCHWHDYWAKSSHLRVAVC